ncbi:MAG: hypothetical protein JWN44_6887 [Myxococcales bacterium]|nr:hypothetical protein [Myxococcales bacterium]
MSGTTRGLSTRQRAFALAATRALGDDAARFCSLSSPALGRQAAVLADGLAQRREAEALARVAPAALDRVDQSWYVAPPRSRRLDGAVHLQRAAYAHLVAMDEGVSLARRTPHEIEASVAALGRRRVALAFIGAPRAGLAQLCARLGEPHASQLVADVRALKTAAPSGEEVKAAQRALFRSGDGVEAGHDLFFRVGAAWLGPALAREGDELRRVAHRLPRSLGQVLLDEAEGISTPEERAAALTLLANASFGAL